VTVSFRWPERDHERLPRRAAADRDAYHRLVFTSHELQAACSRSLIYSCAGVALGTAKWLRSTPKSDREVEALAWHRPIRGARSARTIERRIRETAGERQIFQATSLLPSGPFADRCRSNQKRDYQYRSPLSDQGRRIATAVGRVRRESPSHDGGHQKSRRCNGQSGALFLIQVFRAAFSRRYSRAHNVQAAETSHRRRIAWMFETGHHRCKGG